MACHARREGDEMTCARCTTRWPITEDAPVCLPLDEALARPREVAERRARLSSSVEVDALLRRAREFMQGRNAYDLGPLVQLVEHQLRMGPYPNSQQLLEIMVAAFLTDRDKVK